MTKVIIRDERNDEIKVGELSAGECFIFEGDLYMVTDESENMINRKVVCLDNGSIKLFKDSEYVEKVNNVTISFT